MRVSAAYSRLLQAELKSAIIKKNKLERENAALREDKELLDSNTIWLNVDGQPVWFNGCDLRKAIRRAMKEAGDDDIMRQHLNEGGTPT